MVRLALPGSPANSGHTAAVAVQSTPPRPAALRGLLPIAALLIVWQFTTTDTSLSFPPPTEWLRAIARLHGEGLLAPAITQTLGTYVLGLTLATVIGAAVGVAIGASRRVDLALTPSIDFAAAIPGAALVPVAVLLLGSSPISGVAVVALIVSWPILLNAAMAMRVGRKGDPWIHEERRPRAGR